MLVRLSPRASLVVRNGNPTWKAKQCLSQSTFHGQDVAGARLAREKPYYVTSPIFYVNAAPHVGHLYTLILADAMKRWHALLGQKSILCIGTDEHGMKIQRAAEKAERDPRSFCDEMHIPFKQLAQDANVDHDHFVRTSDPAHRFAVQHFWLVLRQRDLIYEKRHEGWYSVSDETFFPEKSIGPALDPATGRKFMASRETGKEVEWTSEVNYHFRMSEFQDQLLQFYKDNPNFIVPETRMREVMQEIEAGLSDLSVSRPSERLSWGIPVPDDSSQTIYVWVDALINYLTKANFPFQIPGEEHKAGWPPDCHVIGKDIVRFHCIYWPALLMAMNLPLPKRVLTHAHWTLGKNKMSKSTGMVVNPFFAINRFGVDCMRWYLILDGGLKDDAAYDNLLINNKYKKGLQGGLGNLLSRITRASQWSVRKAVQERLPHSDKYKPFKTCLQNLPQSVAEEMERPDPGDALAKIMNVIYDTNVFLAQTKPWDDKDLGEQDRVNEIVYFCSEALRICGILLQPFIPGSARRLLDMLGVDSNARTFDHAIFGLDKDYGRPHFPLTGEDGVLFPPVASHF